MGAISRLCLVLWMMLAAGAASAEDMELDYQAVMHVRSSNAIAVLDDSDHLVGTAVFRGLAVFTGGEVAVHRYEGWFDLKSGSGPFHGYALFAFQDGSTLRAAYDGTAQAVQPEGVTVNATFREFTGTGRFEAVRGTGKFSGRRFDAIDHGGSTYLRGTLTLSIPDK